MRRWYIERNYISIGYYAKDAIFCSERWHLMLRKMASFTSKDAIFYILPFNHPYKRNKGCELFLYGNISQDIQQMFPELIYRRNQHPLIGRVHTLQSRTKGNHIQCRVLIEEQTAFQSGMDSFHLGIYTE